MTAQLTPREERQLYGSALLIALALIGLVLLFASGCAWQTVATKTVLGVEGGAKAARAFIAEPCSTTVMKLAVDKCIADKDKTCAPLRRCEVAQKALHSLFTAILVAKLTIQSADEATAQAAVTAALQAIPPVMRAVEVWR